MRAQDRRLVLETLERLGGAGGLDMDAVYTRLFAIAPESHALFIGDMGERMRAFAGLIAALARDGLPAHAARLRALGRLHAAAGVETADHADLCAALIQTLARALGPRWTPEAEAAWRALYRDAALAMESRLTCDGPAELQTLLP